MVIAALKGVSVKIRTHYYLTLFPKSLLLWHFIYTEWVFCRVRNFDHFSFILQWYLTGTRSKCVVRFYLLLKLYVVWRYSSSQLLLNMFILNEWELSKEGYKTIIPTLSSLELIVYCKDKCVVFSNFSLLLFGGWYCVRKDVDIHRCNIKNCLGLLI